MGGAGTSFCGPSWEWSVRFGYVRYGWLIGAIDKYML